MMVGAALALAPLPAATVAADGYQACLKEALKGGAGGSAAQQARERCRKRFPGQGAAARAVTLLPGAAQERLGGRAGLNGAGKLMGVIRNGDTRWTVTRVIVNLTEPGWLGKALAADQDGRPEPHLERCTIDIEVPPGASREFSVPVRWKADEPFEWNIYEARGYRD